MAFTRTSVASSPNSFQLRLIQCRKQSSFTSPSQLLFFRTHSRRRYHHHRIRLCVASSSSSSSSTGKTGEESKDEKNPGNSWMENSPSGWFGGVDSSENGDSSEPKRNYGGFVKAGVAGVVLAAGVAFASVLLNKRNAPGPKQQIQMEPVTTQNELLLASDDQTDKVEQVTVDESLVRTDEGDLQNHDLEDKTALQVPPGKVLVPAVVDQVQGQALAALQVLKVIEPDVQYIDLCTRRQYARWLVSSSNLLSRNSVSKVYPAMYIENVTDLAFDDIAPEDPDFASIQGLAEAGLIASKLSRGDMLDSSDGEQDPFNFSPESPLSRQDLVSWKMALDKRQLPEVERKMMNQLCGFIDIDKINPDAWPALVADISAGDQGIIALAFGYTRLFQPDKPVTNAQAAIALATGDAADIVSEELARIEAESMAEAAVAAHSALVAKVEKDVNANFRKELAMEKEKVDAIEKAAEEAKLELEKLRAEREDQDNVLKRSRAAVESEMEVLTRLRCELEEQLQSLISDRTEITFERERINKLRQEAESENQAITKLQYDLEVERKALSMARSWAEEEAKRAREHGKALEEARDRWKKHGIQVVVDSDLQDDESAGVTWTNAGKESTIDETVNRAETLVDKLKGMAENIKGKSKAVIEQIILKINSIIMILKEKASCAAKRVKEFQSIATSKASESIQELQSSANGYSAAIKDGATRIAGECKEGVEKITQKFKST
ncbi:uncharacterized protein LOC113274562 isoform X2 [Papaver somniferum]|uniref:uncharacterized protein LOC113274562 isoform X2 n=1 Tax=Papaver somniferum TaxID=3469 RepID=UPI000E6FA3F9|nr:uncharacterized protein LOC113274562 isoform X2 [Papaver somniferum]